MIGASLFTRKLNFQTATRNVAKAGKNGEISIIKILLVSETFERIRAIVRVHKKSQRVKKLFAWQEEYTFTEKRRKQTCLNSDRSP